MKDISVDNIRKLAEFLTRENRTPPCNGVWDSVSEYSMDLLSMKLANAAKNLICEEMGIERKTESLPNVAILNGYPYFGGALSDEGFVMTMMWEDRLFNERGDPFLPHGPLWRSDVVAISDEWRDFASSNALDPNEDSCGDCYIPEVGMDVKELPYMDDDNIYGSLCLKMGVTEAFDFFKNYETDAWVSTCLNYFKLPEWCHPNKGVRKIVGTAPAIEMEASAYGNSEDFEVFWLEHVGVEYFEQWKKGKRLRKKDEAELLALYKKAMGYMRWECCASEKGDETFGNGGQRFSLADKDAQGKAHFLICGHCGTELVNGSGGYTPPYYDTGLRRLSPQFIVAAEIIDSVVRWFDEKYDFIPSNLYIKDEKAEEKMAV